MALGMMGHQAVATRSSGCSSAPAASFPAVPGSLAAGRLHVTRSLGRRHGLVSRPHHAGGQPPTRGVQPVSQPQRPPLPTCLGRPPGASHGPARRAGARRGAVHIRRVDSRARGVAAPAWAARSGAPAHRPRCTQFPLPLILTAAARFQLVVP